MRIPSVLTLINLLACFITLVSADLPLTSETAGGPEATNTKSVQNFEFVFSTWKARRPGPPASQVTAWCEFCVGNDCSCMVPPRRDNDRFADWPGKPQFRSFAPQSPDSPELPRTATDDADISKRSIIVRASQTPTPEPASEARIDDQQQDSLIDRLKQKLVPEGGHKLRDVSSPNEITNTFYSYPLSGYHPVAIPLIVSAGSSNSPITILAYAKTTHFSSFISSSLIADLNRTSEIRPLGSPPLYTPERDLHKLLGYETQALGQISLDIVIGSRDRMVQDLNFIVVEAPSASDRDTDAGWRPDLLVGVDFLNAISGIRLTEEYSGDDRAGAKEGLPILVQRVFEWNCQGDCAESKLEKEPKARDEL